MRNFLKDLRARWTVWRESILLRDVKLACTPDALIVHTSGSDPVQIPWRSIVQVSAFKRDCYTVDSIRLLIATSDGLAYEIAEHDNGWNDVVAQLPNRVPGCPPFEAWFFQVAFPAFETNFTSLYPPDPTA